MQLQGLGVATAWPEKREWNPQAFGHKSNVLSFITPATTTD